MLEKLIQILHIALIAGKYSNQCEMETAEDCMNCISQKYFYNLAGSAKFYCNFWDSLECFVDDYTLVLSKRNLFVYYKTDKNQQTFNFDLVRVGEIIEIKTTQDEETWERQEVQVLSNSVKLLTEFRFWLKISKEQKNLLFWAIGVLDDSGYSFRGFIHVQEIKLEYNLDEDQIYQESLTCNQCYNSCPIWRWPDSCIEHPKRSLSICNSNQIYWTSHLLCALCDADCNSCTGSFFFLCTSCASSYFLVNSVCLNICPYGFATNPCSSVTTTVIDEKFDTDFKGAYGIFQTSNSSATYYFFNNPDLSDPIPAYKRGLYFSPGKYLQTNVDIYLNYNFSMSLWVYTIYSGQIIYKDPMFSYTTSSTNWNWRQYDKTLSQQSYPLSLPNEWTQVTIISSVYQNYGYLRLYWNGVSQFNNAGEGMIFKEDSASPIFLGQGNQASFTGYIYSFTLWNTAIADSSYAMSLACPTTSDASCLWTCDINQYYNTYAYSYCNNCYNGCVWQYTCNICNDLLCAVCSSFEQGSCITCVENASGGGSTSCQCNSGYTRGDTDSCTKGCFTGCAECESFSYTACSLCESGYFLYQNICYDACPAGTSPQLNPNICIEESPFSVQLEFYQLDSAPDGYKASSPIYVNDRGWYFDSTDYVSTTNKLPAFLSISMWAYFWTSTSDFTIFYINRDWGISYSSQTQKLSFDTTVIDWSFLKSPTLTFKAWHSIFITVFHDVQDQGWLRLILDSYTGDSEVSTTTSAIFSDKSYTKYIGCQSDWYNQGKSGFIGYLYLFYVYRDAYFSTPDIESWVSNLPTQCEYTAYWSTSNCVNCNSLCVNGCNNPSDCTLCSIQNCLTCTGSNMCSKCSGDYKFISPSCRCPYTYLDLGGVCHCSLPIEYASICMTSCPTGTTQSGSSCILDSNQGYIFSLTLNQIKGVVTDEVNGFKVLAGTTTNFYPNFDTYDPFPVFERGYYFIGTFMQLPPNAVSQVNSIFFSTELSFSAWLWPGYESGVIFTKLMSNSPFTEYFTVAFDVKNPIIILYLASASTSITIESDFLLYLSHWWYVGFSLSYSFPYSQVNFYLDDLYSVGQPFKGPFEDIDNNYSILIGARNTSPSAIGDYLTGFLYSIKIWNIIVNPTIYDVSYVTGSRACNMCPKATYPNCMPLQDLTSYYDSKTNTWLGCLSSCNYGCVNDQNCDLCVDPSCLSCDDWTGCLQCPTNYGFDATLQLCVLCPTNCNNCTSGLYGDCTGCVSGFYLSPENICLPLCPLGYTASGTSCNAVSPNSLAIHFVFSQEINSVQDKVNGFVAYMGSTVDYGQTFDAQDPLPIYQRGLYFSGASYAKLPPNSEDSREIILGNNHSLMLWIWPLATGSKSQPLFWKGNSTNVLSQLYLKNSLIYADYRINSEYLPYAGGVIMQTVSGSLPVAKTWINIVLVFQWVSHELTVSVYADGSFSHSNAISNMFWIDFINSNCYLGGSPVTSSYFTGFIYEMAMYNYAIANPPAIGSSCGCDACANGQSDCLRSCTYLQYYDSSSSTCADCDSSCTYGCLKKGSCKMNIDDCCAGWTGFTISECTSCVQYASGAGTGCTCMQYSSYNSTINSCNCNPGYWLNSQSCVPCINFLNETSIVASFSSNYSKIQFNSSIPADATTSCCSCLFDSTALLGFGTGYTCSYAADYTSLTISLGKGYTLSGGKVGFLSGLLKNSAPVCGISPSSFSVTVALPTPVATPSFIFSAPKVIAILCQSLIVTASLDGDLPYEQYKWTFSSTPISSTISAYSTQYSDTYTDITIPQSVLFDSIITATFSAKNNFGSIVSKSQSINVTSSESLVINFDPLMPTNISRLKSYSILISSIEACKISTSINLTWKISSVINNITSIDEVSLRGNQTSQYVLIIPPKVLPASSNITFTFVAKDLIYQTEGQTNLLIQTDASDPVISFDRTDGPIGVQQDLVIDASSSYDPDGNSQLSFQWICWNNGNDCSNFILNTSSSLMKILGNSLSLGLTYNFTLILTKTTLNPSNSKIGVTKSIFITTQQATVPSVSIVEIGNSNPGIANPDSAYRIQAQGSFNSILWSAQGSLPISFSTPLNIASLVIAQNSLLSGSTYTLEALIDQQFTFTWKFYVNQGPLAGNLEVTPTSGFEMTTRFEIKALKWEDPEDNLPIEYSFGYFISDIYQIINSKNLSSLIYSTFPYSKDLIIVSVDVYDSLSTKASSFQTISVSYQENANVDQYIDDVKAQLNSEELNPISIPKLVSDLSSLSLNRNYIINGDYSDVDEQMQDSYDLAINKISYFTKDTDPYNPNTYSTIFNMLKIITLNPSINSYDNIAKINDIISELVSNLNGKAQLDDTQVKTFLEVCNNNFQVNSTTVENQTASIVSIGNNIHSINSAVLNDMSSRENKIYIDEKISVEISKQPTSMLSNFSTEVIGASIKLASDTANFVSDAYTGTSMVLYDPISNVINASFSLVSFSLIDLSTLEAIPLNNTNYNYISIPVQYFNGLPTNSSNTTINCTYLEEGQSKWRTDGCVLDSYNKTVITCKCTHLSIFSSFFGGASDTAESSNIGDTVNVNAFSSIDWDTNAIGLYFCAVILIFYIILIMLACKLDAKNKLASSNESTTLGKSDDSPSKIDVETDRSEDLGCKTEESIVITYRHEMGLNNQKQEKYTNISKELSRDSSMLPLEIEVIDPKPEKKRRSFFEFIARNHDFISIFLPDSAFSHSSRVTAYTISLLGNMFFIGLFYQNGKGSDDNDGMNFTDTVSSYSFRDFWVMVYSSGIMIPIAIILRILAKRNTKQYADEIKQTKAKKRNKWKNVAFYLLSWSLMGYFCWSIILFSIQFQLSLTYKWICNTSVSYGSDMFVMPFIKMPIKVFIVWLSTKLIMALGFSSSKQNPD